MAIFGLMAGCSLLGVRSEMTELDKLVYYTGIVETTDETRGPSVVVLYTKTSQPKAVFFDVVPASRGIYHLVAEPGDHGIVAFEDANRNLNYDAGERLAALDGRPVNARASVDIVKGEPLVIAEVPSTEDALPDIFGTGFERYVARRDATRFGLVTSLDNPRFAPGWVHNGVYKPVEFLHEAGPALFMLEPYAPSKVPVIFVHGINASPRVWEAAIASLDRTKFQAWVFYYPTGLSLAFSAWALDQAIEGQQVRHGFDRCHIVAHSMGGLVARGAINLASREARASPVQRLVTISTPWHGHPGARFATNAPLRVPPAWRDMSPEMPYIHDLFERPLPRGVRHTLFFGFAGRSGAQDENNDGAVTLDSMLAYEAQNNADTIYGFGESHASILSSTGMLSKLRQCLDQDGGGGLLRRIE